jgi:hypothetical protein
MSRKNEIPAHQQNPAIKKGKTTIMKKGCPAGQPNNEKKF